MLRDSQHLKYRIGLLMVLIRQFTHPIRSLLIDLSRLCTIAIDTATVAICIPLYAFQILIASACVSQTPPVAF